LFLLHEQSALNLLRECWVLAKAHSAGSQTLSFGLSVVITLMHIIAAGFVIIDLAA
jgi:hypothetical protein